MMAGGVLDDFRASLMVVFEKSATATEGSVISAVYICLANAKFSAAAPEIFGKQAMFRTLLKYLCLKVRSRKIERRLTFRNRLQLQKKTCNATGINLPLKYAFIFKDFHRHRLIIREIMQNNR